MPTTISWTNETWNPTTGCTKISPGCAHCYIERTAAFRIKRRKFVKGHIPLELHEDRLDRPLHWRNPRRVFVNSMSDLFHEDVPDKFIDSVFAVMALADWHTFQVLTKRPERAAEYINGPAYGRWSAIARILKCDRSRRDNGFPLHNVWLGASIEDQQRVDRERHLRRCPAAVRFLSVEPLLERISLFDFYGSGAALSYQIACVRDHIQWVIVGCESGPKRRPMDLDWVRSIRRECAIAGVPLFVKQLEIDGKVTEDVERFPEDLRVREFPA